MTDPISTSRRKFMQSATAGMVVAAAGPVLAQSGAPASSATDRPAGLRDPRTPGAAIINTSSVNAFNPSANLLDYAMTKGAIANFTKGLAKQMVERGVRVNAVAPGPFWTALQVSGGQTTENVKKFGTDTPLGRPGQPAEIAHVYVQLASSESSYVTGQVYGESGGNGQP